MKITGTLRRNLQFHAVKSGCILGIMFFLFPVMDVLAVNSDSTARRDSVVYDYIYLGGRYQNQFAFLGRNFGQSIPFVTGDLTYYTNFNLWVSASAYHFFDSQIPFQSSLAAGFKGDISKRVDYNLSYGQFLMQAHDSVNTIGRIGFYQAGLGLDWGILYSTVQAQVMAYSTQDVFITSQHSRYFEFNDKLFRKIAVSFQPVLSFTWGTSRFYYSDDPVLTERGITNPRALLKSGNANTNNNGVNGTNGNNGNGNGNSGNGNNTGTTPPSDEVINANEGNQLALLNWEFLFPITFQWGNVTLECTSRYSHPVNVIEGDPSRPIFIQSLDLYYSIPVKRKKKIRS